MEGTILVSPNALFEAANEFSNNGSAISNLTAEMTNCVTSLASTWEGDAASAYIAKFRGLDDDIQLMNRMIQEHVEDLRQMAEAYVSAESQNTDEIAELTSDVII